MGDAYRDEDKAAFEAVEGLRRENAHLRDRLTRVEDRLRAIEARGASTIVLPSRRSSRAALVATFGVSCAHLAVAFLRASRPPAPPHVVTAPLAVIGTTPPVADPRPPAADPPTLRDPALAAEGSLSVICIPSCDAIDLDGLPLGPSPVFKHKAAPGKHLLRLLSADPPVTKIVSTVVTADRVSLVRETMP